MNLLKTVILSAGFALLMSACRDSGETSVATAEDEYRAGRYVSAQKLCDSLILGAGFDNLSIAELCRLSMLTSRLADHSDEDSNMALATKCMQAALLREPDSVLIFVHSLPVDDQSRTLFIRQLARTVDPVCRPDTIHADIHDNFDN